MKSTKDLPVSEELKELIETAKTAAEEDIPLENPGEDTRYPGAFSELVPLDDEMKGVQGTEDVQHIQKKEAAARAAGKLPVSDEVKRMVETAKTVAEEDIPLENPGADTRYPGAFSELMPLDDALEGLHGTEDVRRVREKATDSKAGGKLPVSDEVKRMLETVKTVAEEDIPLENPGEDTRYPGAFSELVPLDDEMKGVQGTEDLPKK